MKKTLVFTILLAALLLAACGAQPDPTSMPEAPATSEDHNDMGETSPVPTDIPTEVGSASSEAPAPAADGKIPVQITMGDNWIKSDTTTFKVGQTYVFTITNTGNRVHNFNINKHAESNTNAIKDALANALLHVPDEQLNPGSVVMVEYTFDASALGNDLEFACLIEKHYKSGQFLPIVVEP